MGQAARRLRRDLTREGERGREREGERAATGRRPCAREPTRRIGSDRLSPHGHAIRSDPLQCARGIRRRRRPWISIVRGGYHRVTDLTSRRSDYGASVGILASQLLRHCATYPNIM